MIQRGEHAELPPFDNYEIKAGDVLVLAATRKALAEVTSHDPELFMPPVQMGSDTSAERQRRHKENGEVHEISPGERDQVLVEAMIGPSSRMIGQALHQIGFRQRYKGIVIGVQRKARMIRARMTEIRLEAGDVLLIQTQSSHIDLLRADRDMVLLSGTLGVLPARTYAKRAALIFAGALAAAITGVVPIVLAALAGAGLMLAANTINLRQAARALDMRIMLVVAASLALGKAMDVTGGASYIATHVIDLFGGFGVYPILSVFFLLVALFTNILSNNACAVLFTPIALSLAQQLHADARIFAITVVLAANCSFASPVGYQTNLLVMGPGRYQFADFVRAGLPLVLLLWLSFTLFAPIIWPL
jgi:di/tricarboxylate transporter